jgi:hypothetical protein
VRYDGENNWIVWEGTDGTPAQLTGGGLSPYDVLSARAKRDGRELRIDESAWKVMVARRRAGRSARRRDDRALS